MTPQATKQQILLATIDAIEKNGIQNITTRVIAQEAGVNNAALHYYYGTKEQLLDAALSATIEHWIEDTTQIMAAQDPIRDRLQSVLDYLIDGVLRYPNLIRAHIQSPLMEGNPDSRFMEMLSNWLDQTYAGLESDMNPEQRRSVRIAMHTAISAILMAGLIPETPGFTTDMNLRDEAYRTEFVAYLINGILAVSSS